MTWFFGDEVGDLCELYEVRFVRRWKPSIPPIYGPERASMFSNPQGYE
jgi:hypothetical protein